jgi:BCD family chlorophyll transporter-like MFS transporter
MTVTQTTRLTALLGLGMLSAMLIATRFHRNFAKPLSLAIIGCFVGMVGFILIISTSLHHSVPVFATGAFIIGLANGLFLIATLSIVMNLAETKTAGLYVGLWGLVQTTASGIGTLIGGLTRDAAFRASDSVVIGYTVFYSIELILTLVTVVLLWIMLRNRNATDDTTQPQTRSVFAGLTDIPGG